MIAAAWIIVGGMIVVHSKYREEAFWGLLTLAVATMLGVFKIL